ncbi:MAG: hypothetical protein Q9165_003662 [Trypethelium subeluteriae]
MSVWSQLSMLGGCPIYFDNPNGSIAELNGISNTYTLAEDAQFRRNDTDERFLTGSGRGHALLTSTQLIETLAHFSREIIPEISVHAKAVRARAYFEVTDGISDLTDAAFLNVIGNKTDVLVRVSTVSPEKGPADIVRDFRGFAINIDMLLAWFFLIRDPVKFPSLNRSHKKHPGTNSPSSDIFWDFHINNQESIHALVFLSGDRGLPSSVRHVNAYSGDTYNFTKANGSYSCVRSHLISNQGNHYYTNSEGVDIARKVPDSHLLDLQNAIRSSDFPSWEVYVRAFHPDDISAAPIDIFDMTKVWSKARMFAYPDAAQYRYGVNYQFHPTNAASSEVYCPTQRDGSMNFTQNYGSVPNYVETKLNPVESGKKSQPLHPEAGGVSSEGPAQDPKTAALDHVRVALPVHTTSEVKNKDFEQATALWHIMGKQDRAQARFIDNLSAHLSDVCEVWIRQDAYIRFYMGIETIDANGVYRDVHGS